MRADLFLSSGPGERSFDLALLESAMTLAAENGWTHLSLVQAAQEAGLPVAEVRNRYGCKARLLLRLNQLADDAALGEDGGRTLRERLFDCFMRRFDVFQDYRDGLRAVMRALPFDPPLAAFLGAATLDSLTWMADSAGLDRKGLGGMVRLQALLAIWTHALRAWEKDTSPDLTDTMHALDTALGRAERFGMLKSVPAENSAREEDGLPDYQPSNTL